MSGIYREDQGEKDSTRLKKGQVRKLNNPINKKERGITWHSSQVFLATRAFPWANNRQVTLATRASQATNSSQAGRLTPRASPQASQEDSALPPSAISQAGNPQAILADSTLSLAESELSQAGSSWSSLEDSTLQAESAVLPQAVRCSARIRASQARHIPQAGNSSRQAGTTPRADSMVSQPESTVPQVASPQASSSQEGRSFPSRHNIPQGSPPWEEPNPKWVINLSSKPLTPAQRSVLAKGPNFVVTPKNPPNLEYITAIEAACTKLSQQDAEEPRANIIWVLRASHPLNLI